MINNFFRKIKELFNNSDRESIDKHSNINIKNNDCCVEKQNNDNEEFETILSQSSKRNIAVMEISTNAIKLIRGNTQAIKNNGFSFDYLDTVSELNILSKEMALNKAKKEDYRNNVIPIINEVIERAKPIEVNPKKQEITNLYTVATSVYRNFEVGNDFLKIIKEECGINAKIISEIDEVLHTVKAFRYSNKKYNNKKILLIDQGGLETVISFINEENQIIKSSRIPIGNASFRKMFDHYAKTKKDISDIFSLMDNYVVRIVDKYTKELELLILNEDFLVVATGSVINYVGHRGRNKDTHGKDIYCYEITKRMDYLNEEFIDIFNNVDDMVESIDSKEGMYFRNKLKSRICLKVIERIMKNTRTDSFKICRLGLWHGIYFEKLND